MQKIPFKKISKIISAAIFIFGILIIIGSFSLNKYNDYLYKKISEKIDYEIKKPYLEDYYGGKTPEETLRMFFDALRKDDIELASKYFYLDYQRQYGKYLTKIKNNNELINHLNNWEEEFKNGEKKQTEDGFSIATEFTENKEFSATDKITNEQMIFPAGVYKHYITLEKNENGTWKITNL